MGSLGSRPVRLDLTVSVRHGTWAAEVGSAELSASFSYLDSSQTIHLAASRFPPRQPLSLVWTSRRSHSGQELLCTDQLLGPLLTGTYAPNHAPLAFRVQEDYTDCLRYEILQELTEMPDREAALKRSYLHLLAWRPTMASQKPTFTDTSIARLLQRPLTESGFCHCGSAVAGSLPTVPT